jgi:hypothetical protein
MFKRKKILPEDIQDYKEGDAYISTNATNAIVVNNDIDQSDNYINVTPIELTTDVAEQITSNDTVIKPIKNSTFFTKNKNDLLSSYFKDSCLEGLNISENELGMLIYEKNKYKLSYNKFKSSILPVYCSIRVKLQNYKDFEYLFPNTYTKTLSSTFKNTNNNYVFISKVLELIEQGDFNELSTLELSLEPNKGSVKLQKENNKLFVEYPSLIVKNKGGNSRKPKTRKQKTRKTKTRKTLTKRRTLQIYKN